MTVGDRARTEEYNRLVIRHDPFRAPCSGSEQPGLKLLRDRVCALWPELPNVQGYICRVIAGTDNTSVHGNGRGWDVAINAFSAAGQTMGWEVAHWLAHPTGGGLYEVQLIIFNGMIWVSDRLDRDGLPYWRPFTGANKHHDHLHCEINWIGAALTEHPTPPEEPEMSRLYTAVRPVGGYPVVMDGPSRFYADDPQVVWDLIDAGLVNDMDPADPATGRPAERDYDGKAKRLPWATFAKIYNPTLMLSATRDHRPLDEGDRRPGGEL